MINIRSGVHILFIDEYSMVGHVDLARIDARLRQIRQSKELFGGIHVVLVGDPVQLPPVMATALYRPPSVNAAHFTLAQIGYALFLEFTSVTTLVENMRAKTDPYYIRMLEIIRNGQAPTSFAEFGLLKNRYLFGLSGDSLASVASSFRDAPIIVPTNDARHAFNRTVLTERASATTMVRIDAELSRKGSHRFLITISTLLSPYCDPHHDVNRRLGQEH